LNQDSDLGREEQSSVLRDRILSVSHDKLDSYVRSGSTTFESVAKETLARPGKHLRTLVAVGWGLYRDSSDLLEGLVKAALGIELIHEGSLVHDDVFDQSQYRRGQAAIHHQFGLRTANNFGLYLIARGISMLCETQDKYSFRLELPQINQLVSSQLMETLPPCTTFEQQRHRMEQVTDGKTGVLFRLASVLGAKVALADGASSDDTERAERFGRIIGRAYQIRDDIADFHEESMEGAYCGSDLAAGNWNWPALYWAEMASEWRDAVERVKACRDNPQGAQRLANEIRASGALLRAEQALEEQLQAAAEIAKQIPLSPGRELLRQFVSRMKLA